MLQPDSISSTASQSSSSGWLGRLPLRPKSKTVSTSGRPKCRIQMWLTATRAVSGLSRLVIHAARALPPAGAGRRVDGAERRVLPSVESRALRGLLQRPCAAAWPLLSACFASRVILLRLLRAALLADFACAACSGAARRQRQSGRGAPPGCASRVGAAASPWPSWRTSPCRRRCEPGSCASSDLRSRAARLRRCAERLAAFAAAASRRAPSSAPSRSARSPPCWTNGLQARIGRRRRQLDRLDVQPVAAEERRHAGRDGRLALASGSRSSPPAVHEASGASGFSSKTRTDADLDDLAQLRVVVLLERPGVGLAGHAVLPQLQRLEEGPEAEVLFLRDRVVLVIVAVGSS